MNIIRDCHFIRKKILEPVIVTSPPMRKEAGGLFHRYFPEGTVLVWQTGDSGGRDAIRARLMSGEWPLCVSFYNDYIFSKEEIESMDCLVNIHPALPVLRGRGYDTLPLIENHHEHGVTLHFVTEEIDAGEIIDVISQPVPELVSYPEFRVCNQKLSLIMLNRFLHRCRYSEMDQLYMDLKMMAGNSGFQWSGDLVTSKKHTLMLRELGHREPDHPVLRFFPENLMESGGSFPVFHAGSA